MSIYDNTKWVALSQFLKIFMQVVSLTVLTRLVSPHEYGLMAMATIIINFITILRDLGTSAALIQKKILSQITKSSVFWLNVFLGTTLFFLIILMSNQIAVFFNEPELKNVLIILSFMFPVVCTGSSHQALLERESKFRLIALIEICSSFIGLFFAILCAYKGWGVYSLVLQVMVSSIFSTCLLWIFHEWRPSLYVDIKELKNIFKFSVNLTLFNLITFFSRNIDSALIGKFFNSNVLGAYSLAYRIMLFPLQNVTLVATRAIYPVLSKNQDNPTILNDIFIKTLLVISSLTLPIVCGIVLLSEEFIYHLFGNKWNLAAIILTWLAPSGLIQSLSNSVGCFFAAKGRTDIIMKLSVLSSVIIVVFIMIGIQYNIIAITQFYLSANIINGLCVLYLTLKLLNCSVIKLIKSLTPPILCSVILIMVLTSINYLYHGDTSLILFLFKILLGGGAYLISYRFLFGNILIDILPKKLHGLFVLRSIN